MPDQKEIIMLHRGTILALVRDYLTHLPITEELVESVINNPDRTYADLEATHASILNTPEGYAHPLARKVEDALDEIVLEKYRDQNV